MIDIVELPGMIGFGENPTWTPEGTPLLVDRPTGEEKPPIELTMTVAVVDSLCWMLMLDGLMVMVKSWGDETCRFSWVECCIMTAEMPLPPEPVNVIG